LPQTEPKSLRMHRGEYACEGEIYLFAPDIPMACGPRKRTNYLSTCPRSFSFLDQQRFERWKFNGTYRVEKECIMSRDANGTACTGWITPVERDLIHMQSGKQNQVSIKSGKSCPSRGKLNSTRRNYPILCQGTFTQVLLSCEHVCDKHLPSPDGSCCTRDVLQQSLVTHGGHNLHLDKLPAWRKLPVTDTPILLPSTLRGYHGHPA